MTSSSKRITDALKVERDMRDPQNWRPHPSFNEHPTLIIDRSSSSCGVCGGPAKPTDKSHDVMIGWPATNGKPGCGATWTHLASNYMGVEIEEASKEMRPDLEWCGYELPESWK